MVFPQFGGYKRVLGLLEYELPIRIVRCTAIVPVETEKRLSPTLRVPIPYGYYINTQSLLFIFFFCGRLEGPTT